MKFNGLNKKTILNSFFMIDKKMELVNFNISPLKEIEAILLKKPVIGQNIGDIIPQKYSNYFLAIISECFDGNSVTLEKTLKLPEEKYLNLKIVLTPVYIDNITMYVTCTLINLAHRDQNPLSDYSLFTSHQIRAPITNILSLSNLLNYPKLNSYDFLKIKELLGDINKQAKRLDEIMIMLNSLINNDNNSTVFKTSKSAKSQINRIILVDDDVMINKMHQMILSKHLKEKTVIAFNDPKSALNDIRKTIPDLIFLDINMPDIDGWKFLKILNDYNIKVDVVVLSSTIDPNEIMRAKTYENVKDFISKPLSYDKIKHLFIK